MFWDNFCSEYFSVKRGCIGMGSSGSAAVGRVGGYLQLVRQSACAALMPVKSCGHYYIIILSSWISSGISSIGIKANSAELKLNLGLNFNSKTTNNFLFLTIFDLLWHMFLLSCASIIFNSIFHSHFFGNEDDIKFLEIKDDHKCF